jgi:MFS superfamily sulfate permease-like transporter
MAVQATGAMAVVIADVPAVHQAQDSARALFTLSVLTGVVMLAAGFARLGSVLRFVSNAVMVGFISAVGVNIVLGQLATGYKAKGANRLVRAVVPLAHPHQFHLQSLVVGLVTIARWRVNRDGDLIETEPPTQLPSNEVVALQPYGSLFFAAAPVFESALPAPTDDSRNSVVILRLRGRTELGTTFTGVLERYARALTASGSKLVIVSAGEQVQEQLRVTRVTDLAGPENIYTGDERVGATLKRAYADATAWIQQHQPPTSLNHGDHIPYPVDGPDRDASGPQT